MKTIHVLLLANMWALVANAGLHPDPAVQIPIRPSEADTEADSLVEQMRGKSMQLGPTMFDDGSINLVEAGKEGIIKQLHDLGKEAVPALAVALKDADVQMRRNAELVLVDLAWGIVVKPNIDIRAALPALIGSLKDRDTEVREWGAQALGAIGPDAREAVPLLTRMTSDPDEGIRNSSCLALGGIGPAAKGALPALRNALNDKSKDVRQFAENAIRQIQK